MPKAFDESSRQPKLGSPQPLPPKAVQTPEPPKARLDHVASLANPNVDGQVVKAADNTPHAGAKLLFVSADRQGAQQSVTADGDGRFQTTLASGGWLVYVQDDGGRPVFHEKVDVRDDHAADDHAGQPAEVSENRHPLYRPEARWGLPLPRSGPVVFVLTLTHSPRSQASAWERLGEPPPQNRGGRHARAGSFVLTLTRFCAAGYRLPIQADPARTASRGSCGEVQK